MANAGGPKRAQTRDLEPRIAELERKVSELAEQIARLDERIQKIANSFAASQANRF
jgi:uncharacterized coiled-coil protein SlyX